MPLALKCIANSSLAVRVCTARLRKFPTMSSRPFQGGIAGGSEADRRGHARHTLAAPTCLATISPVTDNSRGNIGDSLPSRTYAAARARNGLQVLQVLCATGEQRMGMAVGDGQPPSRTLRSNISWARESNPHGVFNWTHLMPAIRSRRPGPGHLLAGQPLDDVLPDGLVGHPAKLIPGLGQRLAHPMETHMSRPALPALAAAEGQFPGIVERLVIRRHEGGDTVSDALFQRVLALL